MSAPRPGLPKLERADAQLGALYDTLTDVLNKQPIAADIEDKPYPKPGDPRPLTAFTLVVTAAPAFGDDAGVLLGEVLHNYRGALDHATWSLVRRRGTKNLPPKKQALVQFPLSHTRSKFLARLPDRLPGVPDKPFRAIFERYQPYKRTADGVAMKHLRILTDLDKHRILLPAVTLPSAGNIKMTFNHAQAVEMAGHIRAGRPIQPGTPLMTLVLTDVVKGKTEVGVEGEVTSQPIFPRSLLRPTKGLVAVSIEAALNDIRTACRAVLDELWGQI